MRGNTTHLNDKWIKDVATADIETVREDSLKVVKRFKTIKHIIWQGSITYDWDGKEVERAKQIVDIPLLIGLLDEIKLMKNLHAAGMTGGLTTNRINKRMSIILAADLESFIR